MSCSLKLLSPLYTFIPSFSGPLTFEQRSSDGCDDMSYVRGREGLRTGTSSGHFFHIDVVVLECADPTSDRHCWKSIHNHLESPLWNPIFSLLITYNSTLSAQ